MYGIVEYRQSPVACFNLFVTLDMFLYEYLTKVPVIFPSCS